MPLFRRDPDPKVKQAEDATDSVRAQVGLLAKQIHHEFEELERVLREHAKTPKGAESD